MKVSEMEGAMLDLWVAKALGDRQARVVGAEEHERCETRFGSIWAWNRFMPSGAWMDGGPIIERERIAIMPCFEDGRYYWVSAHPSAPEGLNGPTPLVAAMRAYVATKFGEEVPD